MLLFYFIELFQGIPFLPLPIGKLEFRAPRDKDRRSVVPLVQVAVVDLRRPKCVPIVHSNERSLVQRQGIGIDRGLGSVGHNRFDDCMN